MLKPDAAELRRLRAQPTPMQQRFAQAEPVGLHQVNVGWATLADGSMVATWALGFSRLGEDTRLGEEVLRWR